MFHQQFGRLPMQLGGHFAGLIYNEGILLMKVLGIDPGFAATGLAELIIANARVSGVACHLLTYGSALGNKDTRMRCYGQDLAQQLGKAPPDLVAIETTYARATSPAASQAIFDLRELIGYLKATVDAFGLPQVEVTHTQARAALHIPTKGLARDRASELARATVYERYGIGDDGGQLARCRDHLAWAIGIALAGHKKWNREQQKLISEG